MKIKSQTTTLERITELLKLTNKYLVGDITYFSLAKIICDNPKLLSKVFVILFGGECTLEDPLSTRLIIQKGLERSRLFEFKVQLKGKSNAK